MKVLTKMVKKIKSKSIQQSTQLQLNGMIAKIIKINKYGNYIAIVNGEILELGRNEIL